MVLGPGMMDEMMEMKLIGNTNLPGQTWKSKRRGKNQTSAGVPPDQGFRTSGFLASAFYLKMSWAAAWTLQKTWSRSLGPIKTWLS